MDEAEFNKAMSELCHTFSDEEMDNNRKEEKCSSNDDDSTQTTAAANFPIKSNNNAEWESIDEGKLLIYTPSSVQNQGIVVAYSLDNTLIKTKSGNKFPINHDDWKLRYPNKIRYKLKQFYIWQYKLVIFTNQATLSLTVNINNFKRKIENIVKEIGVPIQVFIATGYSIYRKPAIGMWNYLQRKNGRVPISKLCSLYVGHAAGRENNWNDGCEGKEGDVPCEDLLFARNVGFKKFRTPEEHFLNYDTPIVCYIPKFNPKEDLLSIDNLDISKFILKEQEIILMVGSPGSGKSHFVKNYLKEYEYVNNDTLDSCVVIIEQYLDRGKSVVIDNTNPDPVTRQRYTEIAKRRNIPARCFVMTTSIDHAKHNIKFRSLTDPNYVPVTDVIDSYALVYVPPTLEEGFKEIVEINFMPKFDNKENEKLYKMYLVEMVDSTWKRIVH